MTVLGNWPGNARRFLETYAAELAQRPTWLFAVRGAHASDGDHRDWDEIDRWAEEIAGQLSRSPETSLR